jgi:hypothetical protein
MKIPEFKNTHLFDRLCWADGNGFRVRSNNTTSSQIHVATFNSSAAAHDCPKYINWCGDLA